MRYISTIYRKVTGKRLRLTSFLVTLTSLLIPFAAVSPASAYPGCYGADVCLYQNSNYGGNSLIINAANVSFPFCYNLDSTTGMNDQASSVANLTYHYITYYRDWNCTGYYYLPDSGTSNRANLAYDTWAPDYYYGANDQISSFILWP